MSLCGGSWKKGEGFRYDSPRGGAFSYARGAPVSDLSCVSVWPHCSWKEGEGFSELLASELLASEHTPPPEYTACDDLADVGAIGLAKATQSPPPGGILSSLLACFGAGL